MQRHSPLSRPPPTSELSSVILEETGGRALEKCSLQKSQLAVDSSLLGGQAPRADIVTLAS